MRKIHVLTLPHSHTHTESSRSRGQCGCSSTGRMRESRDVHAAALQTAWMSSVSVCATVFTALWSCGSSTASGWLRVQHCYRSGTAREPALPPPWYFCNEYHHCHLRGTCLRNLTTLIQWAQIAKECLCISVKSEIRGGGALSVKGQPQGAARADSGKLDCI